MSNLMAASSEASTSALNDEEDAITDTPLLSNAPRIQERPRDNQEAILKRARPLTSLVLYFMTIHFLLAFCEMILVDKAF
jgi:hypothetical protein